MLHLLLTLTHPRLRVDRAERLGLRVPPVQPGAIWLHGASVGEVGCLAALLPSLPRPILLTADTDTGAQRARRLTGPGIAAGARPLDHPATLAPWWAEARPRLLVFAEGSWWPGLARLAHRDGVPIVRVSARAGPRTRRVPAAAYRRFTRGTTLVLARDEGEAAWFRAHQDAPVEVIGDLKPCAPLPPPPLVFRRPWVVGASTRPGDEAALLDAIPPGHQLVVAPRHPPRFDEVAALLDRTPLRWARRTLLEGPTVPAALDVLLLDTLGELPGLLPGAAAAFIGGTFHPELGGHSAAEAARAGVPVVAGPHRWANPGSFDQALVLDAATPRDLGPALARAVTLEARPIPSDVAERTAARLLDLLGPPAPERPPRPWATPLVPVLARRPRRPVRLEVPVVAIGSENRRGPGKTSTARWVAARLAERGHRVGVIVPGPGWPVDGMGDEGALFARDGHLVAAGDRVAGARELVEAGATVVVLDDGLHAAELAHDRRILVVDARYPGGRGPFPAGEGRRIEGPLDGIVVHHAAPPFAYAAAGVPLVHAVRRPGPWHRGDQPAALTGPVAAFAGIGRPADWLASIDHPVLRFRALRDHQPIDEALADELLAWAGAFPLVCTEKDAVRWPASRPPVWWRPLELILGPDAERWLP